MQICFEKVSKKYNKVEVLHELSLKFDLTENKVIGIVGPNGAGKSTLMRLISGISIINSGKIKIISDDLEIENYSEWAKKNSYYVPAGDRGLRNKLSIEENLHYFSALRGINYKKSLHLMNKIAQEFDGINLLKKQFDHMSTGQKKKSTILVGMSILSGILLLDEPSNGLDMDAQIELEQIILKNKLFGNQCTVISSHDPVLLSTVVDQYFFINNGNLIEIVDHTLSEEILQKKYHQLYDGEIRDGKC